jgi:hypothetical protein
MADQTPTWLSDSVGGSAPAVQQDAIESVPIDDAVAASGVDGAEAASAPEADEKDLPHVILLMRLANMAAAVLLIACAVRTMLTKRNDDDYSNGHNGIVIASFLVLRP